VASTAVSLYAKLLHTEPRQKDSAQWASMFGTQCRLSVKTRCERYLETGPPSKPPHHDCEETTTHA